MPQIDPVRIESLETFGTPEEVGARVLKVEQGKDGTLDTKLFDARAEKQGDLTLYTLVSDELFRLFVDRQNPWNDSPCEGTA